MKPRKGLAEHFSAAHPGRSPLFVVRISRNGHAPSRAEENRRRRQSRSYLQNRERQSADKSHVLKQSAEVDKDSNNESNDEEGEQQIGTNAKVAGRLLTSVSRQPPVFGPSFLKSRTNRCQHTSLPPTNRAAILTCFKGGAAFDDGLYIRIEAYHWMVLRLWMPAAEQPKYDPGRPITRLCCSEPMILIKVIPRIGNYPELQTYHCERCHNVETIEVEWESFNHRGAHDIANR